MNTSSSLAGKNCLVTGASRGVGYAIARNLAAAGCNLVLTARDKAQLEKAADTVRSGTAGKVVHISCDLAQEAEIETVVHFAEKELGSIDVLINNAGIFLVSPLEKTTLQEFDDCMAVNIRAPFLLTKMLIPSMVERQWGRIVNIGSTSAYAGFTDTAVYCASKHAILGLSRASNAEFKKHGVRVFCVSPGSVKTDMGRQVKSQDFDTFIEPEDIAEHVVFLLNFNGASIAEEVVIKRFTGQPSE
jgi:NAD(P)-dependent dehydrogenase (short-subunit alcohol dehydrogenase family)